MVERRALHKRMGSAIWLGVTAWAVAGCGGGGGGDGTDGKKVDPLFSQQWHLKNTGQIGANALPASTGEDIRAEQAWDCGDEEARCLGAGVIVGVVDLDLEIAHEDLAVNVDAQAGHNYVTGGTDPSPPADMIEHSHGTQVAGLIAARDSNGLGGRGVASRATLRGFNLLADFTDAHALDAIGREVDISNNSWGTPDGSGQLSGRATLAEDQAFRTGVVTGRGGKGIVYLFAAGNGGTGGHENSNYDAVANRREIMAIGAVNAQGRKSSYSEEGANLWISAPGGETCDESLAMTTTAPMGSALTGTIASEDGSTSSPNYTNCMNGTSAATPVASGVVALMLAANADLGWRDVREVMARSARKVDAGDSDWVLNGAGLPVNHKYGFGIVDAGEAVALARRWENVVAEVVYQSPESSPGLAVPDNDPSGVSDSMLVSESGIEHIEWVEVYFSAADHPYAGDLEIDLISPSGTTSRLADTHACSAACSVPYDSWRFGVARLLGEPADGTWRLVVRDRAAADVGTLQSWSLKVYGR